ncbi:MAG: ABC transporter permease [Acidimicrobiaceae bacterium]|nr:ABC transporter permease [Acidimicrobiaceae bacterium]
MAVSAEGDTILMGKSTTGSASLKRRPKTRRSIRIAQIISVIVILGLWQLADNRLFPDYLISSPYNVVRRLFSLLSTVTMWHNIGATAEELALGYLLGVVTGVAFGVGLAYWRVAGATFEPLITIINGIPKIALAPLLLIWFGLGLASKVAIASMTVFFVMFYNSYLGVRSMPSELVEVVKLMGASRSVVLRKVVLPQISTPLVTGLRSAVPFAMIGVIVGEFIAADVGVGYFIRNSSENFDSASVFAGIVVLVLMIIVGTGIISMFERWIMPWRTHEEE